MNPISYLVKKIMQVIPISILNMSFVPRSSFGIITPSLEYIIGDEVIGKIVLVDMNIVSGIEALIDINGCEQTVVNTGRIIDIGLGPTAGKQISSVLSVGYGYNALAGGMPGIVSALTEPYMTCDARVQLISKNVIYVEGVVGVMLTNARVIYDFDDKLNDVATRALKPLSDICVLAAKMTIYNNLILNLHNAQVVNGIAMDAVLDIVSSYSDAAQMYNESIEKWIKIAQLSDRVSHSRLIRMQVPMR